MTLTGRGINAGRKILSSDYNQRKEIRDLQTNSTMPFLFKAVVVDVLYDPDIFSNEEKEEIRLNLNNPNFLDGAPRNSILARLITKGSDHRDNKISIFYPFFPPFICLPAKPGEQVWIIYENPETSLDLGYWMFRPSENKYIDDLNFTHADRRFLNEDQIKGKKPIFPNGGNRENNRSLSNKEDFEEIEKSAKANEIITKEAIPRYIKRPADFVIQGSNNTLIVLGEDRKAGPNKEDKEQAGSIDIVVGRGKETDTKAPEITNQRNQKEVDKFPESGNNENEGNPDFEKDDSRIYLSMKTDGDVNFGIDGKFPKLNGGKDVQAIENSPFCIAKSKEIRIISNEDGSVRIIKEGDNNRATITLTNDGTIMIEGSKIIIGSGKQNQVYIGTDATESAVLGLQLKSLLQEILTKIATHTHTASPGGGPTTPVIPPEIIDFTTLIPAKLDNILSKVSKLK